MLAGWKTRNLKCECNKSLNFCCKNSQESLAGNRGWKILHPGQGESALCGLSASRRNEWFRLKGDEGTLDAWHCMTATKTAAVAVREHYREHKRHQETGMEMRTCPPKKEQAGVSLLSVLDITWRRRSFTCKIYFPRSGFYFSPCRGLICTADQWILRGCCKLVFEGMFRYIRTQCFCLFFFFCQLLYRLPN